MKHDAYILTRSDQLNPKSKHTLSSLSLSLSISLQQIYSVATAEQQPNPPLANQPLSSRLKKQYKSFHFMRFLLITSFPITNDNILTPYPPPFS